MKKIIYCILILILITMYYSCKPSIQYKGNKDLIGNWEGKTIEIISPSYEKVSFAVHKYGFSTLLLNNDSSYSFLLKIMRDVVLEKEVFGNPYAKKILKSGYTNYRRGYYLASASELILYDANKIISNEYRYYFEEQTLYTKFVDKENNQWKISWEK